jgi:hypothetical protein
MADETPERDEAEVPEQGEAEAPEPAEPEAPDAEAPADGGPDAPDEEELRRQLEEEIRKVKIEDVILQSVVSILNLAARRITRADERDLEQGKLGIDAASSLVRLVPEAAQPQLRQAISELQLLYAKHAAGEDGGDEGTSEPAKDQKPGGEGEKPGREDKKSGGEDEKPNGGSRLWTPPGS